MHNLFQVEWYNFNKTRENSLILYFENMKSDLLGTVKKIATFLGKNLSEKVINIITQRTTFENMRKDPKLSLEGTPGIRQEFMNKGVVGNWKTWLNQEHIDFIDQKCREYFNPIGLEFTYE